MDLTKLNQKLAERTQRLQEADEGGGPVPYVRATGLAQTVQGIFNDVYDETGYRPWGHRLVTTEEGAVGEIYFGWDEETGSESFRQVGMRLTAIGRPAGIEIAVESIHSPGGPVSFRFRSDGGNYAADLRGLVNYLRANLRRSAS
jgi:hypothetical protein